MLTEQPDINADVSDNSEEPRFSFEFGFGDGAAATPFGDILDRMTKASKQNIEEVAQSFGSDVIEPPLPFFDLAHLLINNTWHNRSVALKAAVSTQQGWEIICEGEDSADHVREYLDKIAGASDNHRSFEELQRALAIDLESLGNAYVEVVRDGVGRPIELYHVPAMTVRMKKPTEDGPSRGFFQMAQLNRAVDASSWDSSATVPRPATQTIALNGGGVFQKIFFKRFGDSAQYDLSGNATSSIHPDDTANELIHIKTYNPLSPFYGVPDYVSAFAAMLGDESAERWNLSFFENNRIPRWLVVITGAEMRREEKEEFKQYFLEMLRGRPHLPTVLHNGNPNVDIKIHRMEADTNEASFLEYRDRVRDEIIAAHGVPPRMLGIITKRGLGGKGDAQKQREDFKSFTIRPLQRKLSAWVERLILPEMGWAGCRLQMNTLDVADPEEFKKMADACKELVSLGIASVNEARGKLGLPPVGEDWADELRVTETKQDTSSDSGERDDSDDDEEADE